jgi:hypothetical protein
MAGVAPATQYAIDKSGNGNRGTLTGSNGVPVRTVGKIGQGLEFDGVDDNVSLPTTLIPASTRFTIAGWVKPSALSAEKGFLSWWEAAASFGNGFGLGGAPGTGLLFRLNNSAGSLFDVTSNTTLTPNQWTHVAAVLDGTAMRIYVNGTKDSASNETSFSGTYAGSGSNVAIGVDAFSNYFNGVIDDMRVYNRSLSASEIQSLYSGSPAPSPSPSSTPTPSPSPTTLVISSTANMAFRLGYSSSYTSLSQSFIAPTSQLSQATVYLFKTGSPTYPITLSVRSSLTGADLYSTTIQPSQITATTRASANAVSVNLPTPLAVTAGQTYYLRLGVATTDAANYYRWPVNSANPYPDGQLYRNTLPRQRMTPGQA